MIPPERLHPRIYAAQFSPSTRGDARGAGAEVRGLAEEWVSRFYLDRISSPARRRRGRGPQQGHSVVSRPLRRRLAPPWSPAWRRPSSAHPVGWEAELTLAQAGSVAEPSACVRDASPGKPSNTALRRPGWCGRRSRSWPAAPVGCPARAGGRSPRRPRLRGAGLCSPERALPVLVISRDGPATTPGWEPRCCGGQAGEGCHLVLLDGRAGPPSPSRTCGEERACENGCSGSTSRASRAARSRPPPLYVRRRRGRRAGPCRSPS